MQSASLSAIVAFLALPLFAAEPSYFREIRPLLQRQCQGCHQPNLKSSNLDLTTYEGLAAGGKHGPGPALIVKYLTGEMKPQMPLGQPPLPAEQIDLVRAWVAAGGKDDTPAEARETVALGQAGGLHAASRRDRAGLFARRQDARRVGQSRNAAPHAGWQRAAQAPPRSLRPHPLAGLLQGRLAARGWRRHARALRRNSVMGRRPPANCAAR